MSTRGFGAYLRSLVHESVQGDEMAAARHQSFIASHLMGGFLALAVFPVYLATIGRPSALSFVAFAWLASPVLIAVFLSRTGRLALAHLVSAVNLACLVTFAAGITGGITSFLMAWMVVVPIEAALSANRRIVFWAIGVAALAALGLAGGDMLGLLPEPLPFSQEPAILALLGSMSALIYAGGIAISVQRIYECSEQEIRRGEQRYRLLAENATDMITRHDAKGGIQFASVAAQQVLGEKPAEIVGDGLLHRIHEADRQIYLDAISAAAVFGEPASIEFRVRNASLLSAPQDPDPGYCWVEMRCRPVCAGGEGAAGGKGGAQEIVAVTRDISARKLQEDEILRARDAAETANRAKTQFLANMSHELRTPLNAIIGFSEILYRELYGRLGEERYREYAHLIHESGEHLLSVVNEILDMSKIEAGKFDIVGEPFEIKGLVKSCCEVMRHQGEKKSIEIRMKTEPGLPELVADKRACKQILLNLLANAIKFTEEGGHVEVAASQNGSKIELSVADNGIGIAEKDLPKLGNPFVQAESSYDRNYEGAGLGLSVVKGLVRLHGGTFDIESKLGEGTRVIIHLPVDGKQENAAEEYETAAVTEPVPMAVGA